MDWNPEYEKKEILNKTGKEFIGIRVRTHELSKFNANNNFWNELL